jgi:hypothetical protein
MKQVCMFNGKQLKEISRRVDEAWDDGYENGKLIKEKEDLRIIEKWFYDNGRGWLGPFSYSLIRQLKRRIKDETSKTKTYY